MKQLASTGKLRVGVAYAPAPTPVFVAKDAGGDVHGVPRDLGRARALNPALQSFATWLAHNKDRIPLD